LDFGKTVLLQHRHLGAHIHKRLRRRVILYDHAHQAGFGWFEIKHQARAARFHNPAHFGQAALFEIIREVVQHKPVQHHIKTGTREMKLTLNYS
jgi:hypothetical protein